MERILETLQKQNEKLINIENFLFAQKPVLNLDEVCTFTGLSKSHIYKLTCAGKIPHYKQSKHLFFDRAEVETFLKENKVKTQAEIEREATVYVMTGKKRGGVK